MEERERVYRHALRASCIIAAVALAIGFPHPVSLTLPQAASTSLHLSALVDNNTSSGPPPEVFAFAQMCGASLVIVVPILVLVYLVRKGKRPREALNYGACPRCHTPLAPGMSLCGTCGLPVAGLAAVPPIAPEAMSSGIIVVNVENRSDAAEAISLLVNGVPFGSLDVAAGATGQASLRAHVPGPPGALAILEAITSNGRRAGQEVFVPAGGTQVVALRIG